MLEGPPARLMLDAWGACGLYPLALAHASWILSIMVGRVLAPPCLVFGVCDMLHVSGPAGATGPTLIALALSWAAVEALVDDRGPMSPGLTRGCVIFCVAQSNG